LDWRAAAVSARIEPNPVVNDWARENIVGRAPLGERLRKSVNLFRCAP
jgi:hypothetical protein